MARAACVLSAHWEPLSAPLLIHLPPHSFHKYFLVTTGPHPDAMTVILSTGSLSLALLAFGVGFFLGHQWSGAWWGYLAAAWASLTMPCLQPDKEQGLRTRSGSLRVGQTRSIPGYGLEHTGAENSAVAERESERRHPASADVNSAGVRSSASPLARARARC